MSSKQENKIAQAVTSHGHHDHCHGEKEQGHIHLDVTGGIAGDMFAAAMLDANPQLREPLLEVLNGLGLEEKPDVGLEQFSDGMFCGQQFTVTLPKHEHHYHDHSHTHNHAHTHEHSHAHWKTIRSWLNDLHLDAETKRHVIGIFSLLAEAEATIHGKQVDDVCFHEVGAWDSIVDIVAAGWLIAKMEGSSWSISTLPWGGGLAKTDHGLIPVPAPATMELLKGFVFRDDGVMGERITPTGAAILAWLKPEFKKLEGGLIAYGHGFGTKKLEGMSNLLRVSILDRQSKKTTDTVIVMECDIDDQSPESLGVGLEQLRDDSSVIDLLQTPGYGKKNRLTTQLRLLVKCGDQDRVAKQIFAQTTTIGIRWYQAERFILKRGEINAAPHDVRVKWVDRPEVGRTLKVEMDDLAEHGHHHHHREEIRHACEKMIKGEL